VDSDRIGPLSAISLMLQNLGGPIVLVIIQAIITSRTLYLGGAKGPVQNMNQAQLHALDHGYTYGMLWIAGTAVLVGVAALFITYSAADVAHAQKAQARPRSGPRRGRTRTGLAVLRRVIPGAEQQPVGHGDAVVHGDMAGHPEDAGRAGRGDPENGWGAVELRGAFPVIPREGVPGFLAQLTAVLILDGEVGIADSDGRQRVFDGGWGRVGRCR
jgi:hypothetical protein